MRSLSDGEFRRISAIAREEAGLHLPAGKRAFVASRLQRRLRATGIASFATYVDHLDECSAAAEEERANLVSALTTNVTGIFREPHHFEHLAQIMRHPTERADTSCWPVRIWCAGCSSGEEALSIAATAMAVRGTDWASTVRILATDIDKDVLRQATRHGEDPHMCDKLRSGARIHAPKGRMLSGMTVPGLRQAITYMSHNLLTPLPVQKPFDVIFCRNVTIYFRADVQKRVHGLLLDRLRVGGLLLVGHSERLATEGTGMRLIGQTAYRKDQVTVGGVV